MTVWNCGKYVDMRIGQRVTVFRVSSGRTCFGESATLTRTTTQHLVFTTDSGAIVKTKIDNLHVVVGKAGKAGYAVSLKSVDDFADFIHHKVRFWDEKKTVSSFANKWLLISKAASLKHYGGNDHVDYEFCSRSRQ